MNVSAQILPLTAPPSETSSNPRWRWQVVALILLVAWLYYSILSRLAAQWSHDPNFSHGFFVPIFSLLVLWRRRSRFAGITAAPSWWGLPILILSLSVLVMGVLGAELFLSRVSLLMLIAGLIVFFMGWQYFRAVLFPWAVLILMIPLPAIVLNQVTLPLQLLASKVSAAVLPLAGVPVLREGNVINLPAMALEVAEACSGIRSLLSLIALAVIYGYFMEKRKGVRIALALAAVPIAIAANSLRIIGTGLLVQYWDPSTAKGFFHIFSNWIIFAVSLVMLLLLHQTSRIGRVRKAL
jgi:exosortase